MCSHFFFNHANCLESDLIDKKWPENFIIKNIKNSLLDLRAVSEHGFCCRSLTQLNSFVVVTVALLWVLLCLLLTAGAIVQCVSSVGTILWEEPRFFWQEAIILLTEDWLADRSLKSPRHCRSTERQDGFWISRTRRLKHILWFLLLRTSNSTV